MEMEPTSTPSPIRPDPAEVGFEFQLDGAGEHVESHRLLDGVQTGQPVEGPLHPFGRLLFR